MAIVPIELDRSTTNKERLLLQGRERRGEERRQWAHGSANGQLKSINRNVALDWAEWQCHLPFSSVQRHNINHLPFIRRWINISVGEWPLWRLLPVPLLQLDCLPSNILLASLPLFLSPSASNLINHEKVRDDIASAAAARVGQRRLDGRRQSGWPQWQWDGRAMTEMAHITCCGLLHHHYHQQPIRVGLKQS